MLDHNDAETRSSVPYLLGQLTAKVDLLLNHQKTTNERHEALEGRVTTLEKDKAKVLGGAMVLSAIVGFIANHFPFQ